ncbi:EMBP1 protein, partial [Alectura lathami]|nr:EMBP1 protein [Alectura lathami]
MQPSLLLALALLGTASALCSASWHAAEVPAGTGEEGSKFRFVVVNKWRTYNNAKCYCQRVYKGQLASVHSTATNEQLRNLAATYTSCRLWIGAVTTRKNGKWRTSWEDLSPWNYANWASRRRCHLFSTCTTLSPKDGLWRSSRCFALRPFICQY